ncbi:MAG TPA: hypothetical protein VK851_03515 [Anaerolineales bacterium]|nr:hypothetical protein [Anaerolineales bacterium]
MEILNQYSMLLSGIFILGLAALVFLRRGINLKNGVGLLAVALALFAAWLLIRPEQASTNDLAEFRSQIGQGQAVLVEMQSPY